MPQELVPSQQSPRESHCSRNNAQARERSFPTADHAPAPSRWHISGVSIPAVLLDQQSLSRGSSNEHPGVRCRSAQRHVPTAVTAGTGREDALLLLFPLLATQTSGLRQR